jgi:hypothetical protein
MAYEEFRQAHLEGRIPKPCVSCYDRHGRDSAPSRPPERELRVKLKAVEVGRLANGGEMIRLLMQRTEPGGG